MNLSTDFNVWTLVSVLLSATGLYLAMKWERRRELDKRFDKAEQRANERFEKMDERFDKAEQRANKRFEKVDERFDKAEQRANERFEKVDERFDKAEQRANQRFEKVDEGLDKTEQHADERFDKVDQRFDKVATKDWVAGQFAQANDRIDEVGNRVDRADGRMREGLRDVTASVAALGVKVSDLQAEVRAVSTKLDERTYRSGVLVPEATVREPASEYRGDERVEKKDGEDEGATS